jgi:hypothetical protein
VEAVGAHQPGVRRSIEPVVGDELIEPVSERGITVEKSAIEVEQGQPLHH